MSDFKSVVGDFKGNPVISILTEDDKRVMSFGLSKAKAILSRIEDIKKFVEDNKEKVFTETN